MSPNGCTIPEEKPVKNGDVGYVYQRSMIAETDRCRCVFVVYTVRSSDLVIAVNDGC